MGTVALHDDFTFDPEWYEWAADLDNDTWIAIVSVSKDRGVDPEVVWQYMEEGYSLDHFADSYEGEYDDDEDFAQNLADSLGCLRNIEGSGWPYVYIDWERAARDLMMDYFSVSAAGGTHYFRA